VTRGQQAQFEGGTMLPGLVYPENRKRHRPKDLLPRGSGISWLLATESLRSTLWSQEIKEPPEPKTSGMRASAPWTSGFRKLAVGPLAHG